MSDREMKSIHEGENMRRFRFLFSPVAVIVAFVLAAFMSGNKSTDWSKIRKLHGKFVIAVSNYVSDEKAKPLVESSMSGFVVHGEFTVEQVPSSGSVLYRGKANGFMCMTHKAAVVGGTMATSEQVCGGEFNDGEVMVEIMPEDKQYQVGFDGSVPNGKIVVSYPLYKETANFFSQVYELNKQIHPDWTEDIKIDKGLRDDFTAASKGVDTTEEVTFSAASVPKYVTRPGQKFPDMKFFDLPEEGKRIEGAGELQLTVSTSVMPTMTTATCRWIIEAYE